MSKFIYMLIDLYFLMNLNFFKFTLKLYFI